MKNEKRIVPEDGQITGLLSPYLERKRNSRAAFRIKNGMTVCDLGCGRGYLLDLLLKKGKTNLRYVGVDVLPDVICGNKKRYPEQTFIIGDITTADVLKQLGLTFDVFTLLAIIEHIDEPEKVFRRLASYLKPGGQIIVTTPRRGGEFIYFLGSKLGLFSKEACAEHKEKFLNKAFLRELAEKTGLKLTFYEKFLFGFNQLAVYQKGSRWHL